MVLGLSVIPGLLAVLVFLTLVNAPQQSPNPGLRFFGALHELPTRFKRYLCAVGLSGLGNFSHSLLILAATFLVLAGFVWAARAFRPGKRSSEL